LFTLEHSKDLKKATTITPSCSIAMILKVFICFNKITMKTN